MAEILQLTFIAYFYLFFAFHKGFVISEPLCKFNNKSSGEIWTNCSHLELSLASVKISVSTTHLILSNNLIKTINPGNFKLFKNLTYLDISNNFLKKLDSRSFIGLTKLTV